MKRQASVTSATRAQLTGIGKLDSPLGATAMVLAGMLDDGETPATARTQAAKELRAVLEELTRNAPAKADPIDELRLARERRQKRGA